MLLILPPAHALNKNLFDDPCECNHANNIGRPGTSDIASKYRLKNVGDEIEAWGSGNFRVPRGKVVVAKSLCLWDVKDLVLVEKGRECQASL